MPETTTISVRVSPPLAKEFDTFCDDVQISKSNILRACVDIFVHGTATEKEKLLVALGFSQKVSWVR